MEFYIEKKILQNILNTKKVYDVLSKKSPDESMWTKNLKNIFIDRKSLAGLLKIFFGQKDLERALNAVKF